MKKVFIIDGDGKSRNVLKGIIKEINKDIVIYETDNVAEAFGIALTNSICLFIVDIVLKSGIRSRDNSGASFIMNIRGVTKYRYTPIIVVSGVYDDSMIMYANAHIYRYIEKPLDYAFTKKIIEEALELPHMTWRPDKVIYQVEGLLECIDIDTIIYAQSCNHIMKIVTYEKEYNIPHLTCKKLIKDIDDGNFVMCFRGCIVNVRYIKNIDKVNRYITLNKCADKLEIGMKYKKSLLDVFLHRNI